MCHAIIPLAPDLPSTIPRDSQIFHFFPFLTFLCMGALLGVMQFPWSQLFDWAHMHPGRLVNEFDFVWAVVCFFVCFYLSSALLESSLPRRRVEGRSFPNISSLLFMAIESRGEARNMRLAFSSCCSG